MSTNPDITPEAKAFEANAPLVRDYRRQVLREIEKVLAGRKLDPEPQEQHMLLAMVSERGYRAGHNDCLRATIRLLEELQKL